MDNSSDNTSSIVDALLYNTTPGELYFPNLFAILLFTREIIQLNELKCRDAPSE